MLEDILRAQAQDLNNQLEDHDADAFMHRLAVRIAEDAASLSRPSRCTRHRPGRRGRAPRNTAAYAHVAAAYPPGGAAPSQPDLPPDPVADPAAVLEHVRGICQQVVSSQEIDSLADFADVYDEAGARTFACLLYTLGRREGALFWWRFAAGAGDPLAAHLLAAYHAAVGTAPDARLWRAFSRLLGFTDRHLPRAAGKLWSPRRPAPCR